MGLAIIFVALLLLMHELLSPDWLKELVVDVYDSVFNMLRGALKLSGALIHLAGKICTFVLLAGAMTVLANEFMPVFGLQAFIPDAYSVALQALFVKPYVLAAATILVATTVAIYTSKKFDLDYREAIEKSHERWEKRNADKLNRRPG